MERVVRNLDLKKVCIITDDGVIIIKSKDCVTLIIPDKEVKYKIVSSKENKINEK